ncbi:MAG: hypothetical protein FWG84_07380 [Bacteroidales bacterium]|nr:hypothetical protein [Bacteroidales bacterium]
MKKYLPIGSLIRQELKAQERPIAWLTRKVDYSGRDAEDHYSAMCKILKRNHIDSALLWSISKVLKYDFFARYSAFLREQLPGIAVKTPTEEVIEAERVPIGELICRELKRQERSISWLAEKTVYSHGSLCMTLKRDYIDTALLLNISKVLEYDFFAYFCLDICKR